MSQFDVDFRKRQDRLELAIGAANIDAMALNAGPSLTYLSGLNFHLSERPVVGLFTPDSNPVIILPELEAGKLSDLPYQVEFFTYGEDPGTWSSTFREGAQAAELSGKRVGVEPRRLRVLELRLLENAADGIQFVSGEISLSDIRMLKDEAEQAAMQKAVNTAQKALEAIIADIRPGVTERELASEVVINLLREGSDAEMPFAPIVASGPNSANPHATPTERRIETGDQLIIDWGANIGGYFSDLTRTFAIGEPQDEMKQVARVVLEANEAAREKAGPGIPAQEVDRAARQVIEDAGYGEFFVHRTGHGLGMESHEHPYIREGNLLPLAPGMTFTIEPGVYMPGKGGVRIEDNVVITNDGTLSFSNFPRALRILGE